MASDDHPTRAARVFADLPKFERRKLMRRAAGRTLISLTVLIGIYILIPPDRLAAGTAFGEIVIGTLLLSGLIAWEIYRIINARNPEIRAAESLLIVVAAVIILFSLAYATMSAAAPDSFSMPLDKSNAVYFTVTTLATVGFGDITAVATPARWVVTGQMLFDLVLLVGLARVIILAAKAGRARQDRQAAGEDDTKPRATGEAA